MIGRMLIFNGILFLFFVPFRHGINMEIVEILSLKMEWGGGVGILQKSGEKEKGKGKQNK